MNKAERLANQLLEADEEQEYIETRQEVRPQTAARLDSAWTRMWPQGDVNMAGLRQWRKEQGQPEDQPGDTEANMTIGSTDYEKEGGKWYRIVRRKNPKHWEQPQYFWMAPGPGKMVFIVVKMPRGINQRIWRSACAGIYMDATGHSWNNVYGAKKRCFSQQRQPVVVEGTDEKIYNSRLSGEKPEPAYEIFADGTWKRTAN